MFYTELFLFFYNTCIHFRFYLSTQGRAGRYLCTQHITGGQMTKTEFIFKQWCLKTKFIRDPILSSSLQQQFIQIKLLTCVPLPEPGGPRSTAFIPIGSSVASLGNGCAKGGIF
jgi:hypothetical protein